MIEAERIRRLNDRPERDGAYVLYWMQQSQRASFNPALELAIGIANDRKLPVVVGFGLMDDYPEANARHYTFMLQGLREVEATLAERGIAFVIRRGAPDAVALDLAARRGRRRLRRRLPPPPAAVAQAAGRRARTARCCGSRATWSCRWRSPRPRPSTRRGPSARGSSATATSS